MNLLWPIDPPGIEHRCLEYYYTKLGRQTYFSWWPPRELRIDALNTATPNLADRPSLANEPSNTRAEMTCIPLHKTWQMNLLWLMVPQYQSRDDLHTTTQNLADEPTLANGPPITRAEMTCIPLNKTWQMNLFWPMDPPGIEHRCLEYCYTKLGRQTYFSWWPPRELRIDALNTATPNLADRPSLANEPSNTRAEMTCIPLHKTWQMNLFWPMDPPGIEHRCLEYCYTKLGRQTYFSWWPPRELRIDALNTATPNLADRPSLANEPSNTRAEMTCIPLHKTWQMNLLWLNTIAKV